ncbi:helix-turn-helix domain-containing protein [Nibribacter ruber]|uniref:Helix-turn-helix domain-containing protein n=1 Tax=Nibribacter ruber TaxID=2698458 RepID=A0A6P1NYA2_9BACT|nr:helix-turn-helix transcriptional regulator [Nibribacter ruber]QHL86928.1 helix-turn-helix domain-containing protein [Nibribacter ruber]
MKTIKFNKTECGVDFLINVINGNEVAEEYLLPSVHNADYFEILFFRKGSGQLFLDNQRIQIEDNTILFVSPFQKKKWSLDLSRLDFTILIFQEDFLNEFFTDKLFTYRLLYFYQHEYPLVLNSTEKQAQSISNILAEVKAELVQPNLDSAHIIRSLIYYLLQRLNRDYAVQNNLPFQVDTSNHAYTFKKLMESHIKEAQRINDYAEMMGISRITLNAAVKKQFNITATELLRQRLLTEIKNELIYSDKSIGEIAYALGYSEPNHLMRFFKSQTGMTTSEFIADYQNIISS